MDGAEGVVVHLERVGQDVVGVVDRGVVLAVRCGDGGVVGLEGCDQAVQRGTRVDGHATTVAFREAQWQRVRFFGTRRLGTSRRERRAGRGGDGYGQTRTKRPDWVAQGGQYEYRVLRIPATTSRNDARRMLTEHAELGRWELSRTLLFAGGERKVWLRRKVIRVRSTLAETSD